jgi:hypothetical protein
MRTEYPFQNKDFLWAIHVRDEPKIIGRLELSDSEREYPPYEIWHSAFLAQMLSENFEPRSWNVKSN